MNSHKVVNDVQELGDRDVNIMDITIWLFTLENPLEVIKTSPNIKEEVYSICNDFNFQEQFLDCEKFKLRVKATSNTTYQNYLDQGDLKSAQRSFRKIGQENLQNYAYKMV